MILFQPYFDNLYCKYHIWYKYPYVL